MAYINQRGTYWRAEVRRRGFKPVYRTFDTRTEAQKWARLIESEMDSGLYVNRTEAEQTLFSDALKRYQREIVPTKRHPYQEHRRIERWLKNDLAFRTLGNLRGADFARYRDERRAQRRAENTIRLELQIISHLFEIARKEWGMEGLANPLNNIRKPGGSSSRERRLLPGEYEQIYAHLSSHINTYALAAFVLAVETSLRQGTLFSLRWEWVDFTAHLIKIPLANRGSKNKGIPAALPLSSRARAILESIRPKDTEEKIVVYPTGPILNTTQNAVVCIWKRMQSKLGINDLRWHDLRHEAASRLFERGLHPLEVASITGHRSMQMLKRYTHLNPENLLSKLG